jgi:Tfp pilus assembly protein PilE
MSRLTHRKERGDTIIEVLFAVTVFALVAVGSLAIMNQGTNTAQRSLEITQVRAQMDAQAAAIRFIHESYVAQHQSGGGTLTGKAILWSQLKNRSTNAASEFGAPTDNKCTVPNNAVILNARTVDVSPDKPLDAAPNGASLPPYAQVAYRDDSSIAAAYGIWDEVVYGKSKIGPDYYDFHIRACWDAPGSDVPVTLGTIVRLYEPSN